MTASTTRTLFRRGAEARVVRATIANGPWRGASVTSETIVVGRSPGAGLRVEDPTVSEYHVELSTDQDGISIRDLDSTNGTFFGNTKVAQAVVQGGTLTIGETSLLLEMFPRDTTPNLQRTSFGRLVGRSMAMRALFEVVAKVAATDLSVLVEGPAGVGKELVARELHAASRWGAGAFIAVDCTALPPALAESLIFGQVAGAFAGATSTTAGILEAANGGTLFLDEVGALPLELQPKVFRALEQGRTTRLGEATPRNVSLRVIASSRRDLRQFVNQGAFRHDLYARLAQARVVVPTLAERREDIEQLVSVFLHELAAPTLNAHAVSRDALEELGAREFQDNVRELRTTIRRAAIVCEGPTIRSKDLAFDRLLERAKGHDALSMDEPSTGEQAAMVPDFKEAKRTAVDEFEREYLARLMNRAGGNLSAASGLAAIERHYLRALLRKHGLASPK